MLVSHLYYKADVVNTKEEVKQEVKDENKQEVKEEVKEEEVSL